MKLNFVLVLCALFAYSKGMELSHSSQTFIRSNLNTHSCLTESDYFVTHVDDLAGVFKFLDEEGSIKLAKVLVQAYKNTVLTHLEIQMMMLEAVRFGKFDAYRYFAEKINYYSSYDIICVAAINGYVDILDHEYAIDFKRFDHFTGSCGEMLAIVVKAGHHQVLRWFAEKGLMKYVDANESLFTALENHNQGLIVFLLLESKYIDINCPGKRFTFKECFIKGQFGQRAIFLVKAAAVGNVFAVRFFLDNDNLFTINELKDAFQAASKKNHNEIAKLIDYYIQNIDYYLSRNVIVVAATNGDVDILDSEYAIDFEIFDDFKGSYGDMLARVVKDGHYHVLRWFAEKGLMKCVDARESLLAALEYNIQELVVYLLEEPIYIDIYCPGERFTFKQCLIKNQFSHYGRLFVQAAAFGNMYVVRYFLYQDILLTINELTRALRTSAKNNHTEIADLIADYFKKYIQEHGKNGTLDVPNSMVILDSAIEANKQNITDLLLHEEIYKDPLDSNNRLNYGECIRRGLIYGQVEAFHKAAEAGNMVVFHYYLVHEFVTRKQSLEKAGKIAAKNNHTEISELVQIILMI